MTTSTATSTSSSSRAPRRDQAGTGLIGSVFGVLVFLFFLFLSAQVLIGLYASSIVSAAAYSAAKAVAGADAAGLTARAEDAARRQLGAFGPGASFEWSTDGDAVNLSLTARRPQLLPDAVAPTAHHVTRSVRVRLERLR